GCTVDLKDFRFCELFDPVPARGQFRAEPDGRPPNFLWYFGDGGRYHGVHVSKKAGALLIVRARNGACEANFLRDWRNQLDAGYSLPIHRETEGAILPLARC